jgi:hypothetical protein
MNNYLRNTEKSLKLGKNQFNQSKLINPIENDNSLIYNVNNNKKNKKNAYVSFMMKNIYTWENHGESVF